MTKEMDYERVLLLLEVIERTLPHGPAYNDLRGEAAKELNKMIDEFKKNAGKIVTPPDGPANSAVSNEDGTYTRILTIPIRMAGESDEAWEKRQEEYAKLIPQEAHSVDQPKTDPRANERAIGETEEQHKAKIDQEAKAAAETKQDQSRPHDQKPANETTPLPRRL